MIALFLVVTAQRNHGIWPHTPKLGGIKGGIEWKPVGEIFVYLVQCTMSIPCYFSYLSYSGSSSNYYAS